ncbi:MAG: rod shape-determining protein MreD [Rubrobacter sp.]
MVEQASVVRASVVVAVAVLLEAVLGPYLTLGYVSPKFALIGVVFAVSPLRDLQAILLGFFGGILLDSLGSGLFGVGALAGLAAATLASRVGAVQRRGTERLHLAQVVAVSVLAYDLLGWMARSLADLGSPPFAEYAVAGILPDALLNAVVAYLVGGWLLKLVNPKKTTWEST